MPKVHISVEAAAELQRRIAAYPEPGACAVVIRQSKQGDVTRGPKGEVLWTIDEPAEKWSCVVFAIADEVREMDEFKDWSVIDVDGVRFGFLPLVHEHIGEIWVELDKGDLRVDVSDA